MVQKAPPAHEYGDPSAEIGFLTNASDGKSQNWINGVLGILQRFHDTPLPEQRNFDWSGRWWAFTPVPRSGWC